MRNLILGHVCAAQRRTHISVHAATEAAQIASVTVGRIAGKNHPALAIKRIKEPSLRKLRLNFLDLRKTERGFNHPVGTRASS